MFILTTFSALLLLGSFDTVQAENFVHYVKVNESFDLTKYCDKNSTWHSSGPHEMKMPLTAYPDKSGSYYCKPENNEVLVIIVKELDFTSNDDNATLTCSIQVDMGVATKTLQLNIFQSPDKILNSTTSKSDGSFVSLGVITSSQTDKCGRNNFTCEFIFDWNYKTTKFSDSTKETKTFLVNQPVWNVDVQLNKNAAMVGENVTCTSDGCPSAHSYQWSCSSNNSHISVNEIIISFNETQKYNCTCTATNKIGNKYYSANWTGVIQVLSEKEYKKLNEKKLSDGEIVGIVIGCIIGLVALVVLILWLHKRHRKQKQIAGKEGENKTSDQGKNISEAEHLETFENEVYGKL